MKEIKSRLLLILQLLTIGYIFIFADLIANNLFFQFIQLIGVILAFWAFYYLAKFSKFNAFAEVRKNASLVTSGPYKWIRNPIYLAVLLYTLPLIIENINFFNISTFLILLIVLLLKIELEETYLIEKFDTYNHYKKKTWKLIPFIF